MTPKWSGQVKGGKIKLDNPQDFKTHICSLEGKRVNVVVKRYRTDRTLKQNSYYWGYVVQPLAEHLGYTKEEMDYIYRKHFLMITKNGEEIPRKTDELTTTEMSSFIEQIKRWASEFHEFYIPDSDEIEV